MKRQITFEIPAGAQVRVMVDGQEIELSGNTIGSRVSEKRRGRKHRQAGVFDARPVSMLSRAIAADGRWPTGKTADVHQSVDRLTVHLKDAMKRGETQMSKKAVAALRALHIQMVQQRTTARYSLPTGQYQRSVEWLREAIEMILCVASMR